MEEYLVPEIEFVEMENEDIIIASGGGSTTPEGSGGTTWEP